MENKLIKDKYSKADIYQAKPLIEACKEFDINEGRLFYLGLLELRPQLSGGCGQREFDRILIPTPDVIKLFGGNKSYYQRLRNVSRKLQSRLVTVKEEDDTFHRINIFREMQFDKKKGGLSIRFNEDMRPYILELAGKPYTKIAARTIFSLSSVYAIRLLELLLEYQNIPRFQQNGRIERSISIEDLRFYCNVGKGKYAKNSDFTRNIVKRPVEEINRATGYRVSFSCRRNGRAIEGYDFVMEVPAAAAASANENIEQMARIIENAKIEKASSAASGFGMYAELIGHGIGKIVAKRLVEAYGETRIRSNIEYAMRQAKVKNKSAYLRRAIEDDYAATRPMQQDIFGDARERDDSAAGDLAALRKLGFGMAVSRNFISVAESGGRFGMTERNLCSEAGIPPEALLDALKKHDFSALCAVDCGHGKAVCEVVEPETAREQPPAASDPVPARDCSLQLGPAPSQETAAAKIAETALRDAAPSQEAAEMKELTRLMQLQLRMSLPADLQRRLDELAAKHLGA